MMWNKIKYALWQLTKCRPDLRVLLRRSKYQPDQSVSFAIAAIALGAKIAKADGRVTRTEVRTFREFFDIPAHEEKNVARLYDLASRSSSGFEYHAATVARLFRNDKAVLEKLLEVLFAIAVSDGKVEDEEEMFLERVSDIFGISDTAYERIRRMSLSVLESDPYRVLGVDPADSLDKIRDAWRQRVMEYHPDRLSGQKLPESARRLATQRIAAINAAWDEIKARTSG